MKRFETSLLLALCLSLCWSIRVSAQQDALENSIIRLHVVAASDAPEEQELKKRVRDSVLSYLDGCTLPEELTSSLDGIKIAALSCSENRDISVSLCREDFPARSGDGYSLPAGNYKTLRVTIGEGQGHNWWGIIFPQFMGGTQEEIAQTADIIGKENLSVISGGEEKYEIRFKILEILQSLREKWT